MSTPKALNKLTHLLALLLGQASLLWGLIVAPAYWFGFALLLPQGNGAATSADLVLSPLLPAVGLILGSLGWTLAGRSSRQVAGFSVAGLALNALALALALFLVLARAAA